MVVINNARTALGVGEHTVQIRHCNSVGGCSQPLNITFTISAPTVTLFQFNPDVMVPGDTSNVWPVPSSVTDVYLDVTFSPSSSTDIALVPFPARFVDTGKLPLTLDSCLRGND